MTIVNFKSKKCKSEFDCEVGKTAKLLYTKSAHFNYNNLINIQK